MRRLVTVAVAGAIAAACGGSSNVAGSYTVVFQSTSEAIAASDVRVFVFDASVVDASEPCLDLLYLRESGQDMPEAVLQTGPTPTCSLASGAAALSVPFGQLAVLVVAETPSGDLARGCAVHQFSSSNPSVTITLALAAGQAVPPTTCTSLSQRCGGKC